MKKITFFCLLVFLLSMSLVAEKDSLTLSIKAESWESPVIYEPVSLLRYRNVLSKDCIYDYEMLLNKTSGSQTWQSIAAELSRSLFHQRANLSVGIGLAEVGLGLNQPEFEVNSNFTTKFGESPDSQTCLGDSVSAKSKYQLFWYVGAKLNILKGKNWKAGVEGRYLSMPNFDFSFPLQYKSNDWKKADMEFSIKGNSMKLQMAEVKMFATLNLSKKLEVTGAVGYFDEKKEVFGASRYFYQQNLVNIDYNQEWKLVVKPETNWFAEGSISATLTRNLKAMVSGSFGAKRGFAVGISYSFGKKETAAAIIKSTAKTTPTPTANPAPAKSIASKKVMDKPNAKPEVKSSQKKTAVAPKEEAKKPAITKSTKPESHCCKPVKTTNSKNVITKPNHFWFALIFSLKMTLGLPPLTPILIPPFK